MEGQRRHRRRPDTDQPLVAARPFDGIPLESSRKRLAGWSAERQRLFLTVLAETGQVHLAAAAARLSVRSAQALRVRSPAFNVGWRMAELLGAGRLAPIAFDRAINGRVEQVYEGGELVAERRVPNDKLLMWLLARLDPKRFASRGSSAAMRIRSRKPPRLSPRCSMPSPTWPRELLRHCEHSRTFA